ncbi:MAG: UMP kinase [Termitinemataceae bacterium]|nr:MAG: UMP kinase [Termitinemataceae bacterium]
MLTVISLGGSIVAPDKVDEFFLAEFVKVIVKLLNDDTSRKFVFVVGGGGPARAWQTAFRNVSAKTSADGSNTSNNAADWIGIMATRLNAQLVKSVFADFCTDDVVTDPTAQIDFTGRILVAAGWKPGFSTDNDAVLLAEKFGAKTVINLSNIEKVYTDDPKKNPDAKPIDTISWSEFCKIVGSEWHPGINVPFDPVASKHAMQAGLTVICAAGHDLHNLQNIIAGKNYTGTTIGHL